MVSPLSIIILQLYIMISVGCPLRISIAYFGKPLVSILILNARHELPHLKQKFCTNRLFQTKLQAIKMADKVLAGNAKNFRGTMDRYNGVTVDSSKEPCEDGNFEAKLTASLDTWQDQKIRGVWFKVALQHSHWVPLLAKYKFWYHHARPEAVMMVRWLPDPLEEPCNIPSYCHTMVGVGGLVTDTQGRLLVVKERFWQRPSWKLPGGYLEMGEDIGAAVVREVQEETGVLTKFSSLVAFRHSHFSQFGCSDIYVIAHLTPENEDQPIRKCEREIAECCWMKTEEFLHHPEVYDLNRLVVSTFLENKASGVSMPATQLPHPLFKDKKVMVYSLNGPPPSSLL